MKAIHNPIWSFNSPARVVLYPKDTEKWKQFTTIIVFLLFYFWLFCIPKILKNESNSQPDHWSESDYLSCFVSQRYWKMKAIHNNWSSKCSKEYVVLYPKDTEKWKQFTTWLSSTSSKGALFCIPKILKNESNSQLEWSGIFHWLSCFVSQRYWKMKAIHNSGDLHPFSKAVVLYPKDTEKWKQFTTIQEVKIHKHQLFCIPKILKNESNSQLYKLLHLLDMRCFVSQRYWKMKAIHNWFHDVNHQVSLFCIPKILKNESNSQHE